MQLIKYNPFLELQEFDRDFDRLMENSWDLMPAFAKSTAMDMYEEGGNLVTEVTLPNFKKKEIKVTAKGGMLEVSAEHQQEAEKKTKRQYYFHETSNQYFRRVSLPKGAQTAKTTAEFKNGVLRVSIPMTAPTPKEKAISVNIS